MSRPSLHFVVILLSTLPTLAGEREAGAWDNFNAPVLSLRPAKPVVPVAAPEPSSPTAVRRLAAPALTLAPAEPSAAGSGMDSGFFSGAESTRWRLSRTLERRTESLRQEWANRDAKRLEDERAGEGVLNKTLRTVFPEPETFRIGTHEVGGGFPTAIRRRNPFALINPNFLSFSF
jgi:hypothetical protein